MVLCQRYLSKIKVTPVSSRTKRACLLPLLFSPWHPHFSMGIQHPEIPQSLQNSSLSSLRSSCLRMGLFALTSVSCHVFSSLLKSLPQPSYRKTFSSPPNHTLTVMVSEYFVNLFSVGGRCHLFDPGTQNLNNHTKCFN